MKRLFSILLCLCLLSTMALASGEAEKKTLTVICPVSAKVEDYDTNAFILWLEEETGIDVEWVQVPTTSWADKISAIMVSGDYPDVISFGNNYGGSRVTQQKWADEGLIIPLDDLIEEYGVYSKKMFEEERGTLLPAALIVEGQRAFGGKGLLSMLEEKPVYAEHPKVKQYAEGLKRMATATVVTSGRTDKVKADEKAAKDAFIGQQFTDFEMADTLGNTHKLSEYVGKGHWVLVDFWASWCGPCLREMPNVVAAYEKYHTKGLDIVGVSLDGNRNPWVKAITKQNMPWVHLSDLKAWESLVTKIYKINAIPDNLLIDPQGKVVARELFGEALHEKLKEIFKEE